MRHQSFWDGVLALVLEKYDRKPPAKVPDILKETSGTALYVYNTTQQLDLGTYSCNLCKKFLVNLREENNMV